MDENPRNDVLLKILNINTERLKTLTSNANTLGESLNSHSPSTILLEAEMICAKLESGINKLNNDLNNYFRLINEPAVDEISQITLYQLEAEESLCELRIKIKRNQPSTSNNSNLVSMGKLPKITLPEFDGDILQFHQFWDQFVSQVESKAISDVDKLIYLNCALKGDAKKLIEGLETTNKNYAIAVATLKARYGRIEIIKDAHFSALNKLSPANSSITECRNVFNDIEKHLRVLESLGEDTSHSYLRFMIMEKFPEDLVYEVRKQVIDGSVAEIRTELGKLISAKEDALRLTGRIEQKKESYSTETLQVTEVNTANTFKNRVEVKGNRSWGWNNDPTSSSQRTPYRFNRKRNFEGPRNTTNDRQPFSNTPFKKFKRGCMFCSEDHENSKCEKFKTVRERKLKLKNRCYHCFRFGHNMRFCRNRPTCEKCKNPHNTALCMQEETQKDATNQLYINNAGPTILQTAIVKVSNGNNRDTRTCRALLDSGSQRTYITQRVAKVLKLKVIEENKLMIFTFGSKTPQEINSPRVEFLIATNTGEAILFNANVVPTITHSVPYHHFQGTENEIFKANLADDGSLGDQVDMLIGNDYYFSLISTEKRKIQDNLYMIQSKLGWILSGKIQDSKENDLEVVTYFQTNLELKLNQPDLPLNETCLKNLWDLEVIGITDSPKESREEEAIRQFNETTKIINNRYQVSWPWIEYPPNLKPNFGLAFGRLVGLVKRLDNDTLRAYDLLLKEQKEKGIIEVIPEDEINQSKHTVHYLPHHGVKQANKPIRIVYDASSKTKDNKSLNQCLYCGPTMLEDLTGILLKFRLYAVGICADVEKAFLQIGLHAKDRDVTRFLWLKDINEPAEEKNLLHMRFCRVPFGVIASPFLLNATVKHHLAKSDQENIRNLTEDIYVDNLVTGTNNTEEAMKLYENAKHSFKEISMNLREWSSNLSEFISQISDNCQDRIVKILGLYWDTEMDSLHLKIGEASYADTKRGILKCIASIYDPCGYTIPVVLHAKLLLQDLWKLKIKWDTPLPADINEQWKEIREQLNEIKEIVVPRQYIKEPKGEEYQLHCFSDASLKAYSAVVYLVQGTQKSFVIGKSRLVPIKDQADLKIPRLELLGVLIGSRLVRYVQKFLKLNIVQQILWTDSRIVIDWYHSNKLLTPFVSRRIAEIKGNKKLSVRFVPSELNAADIATRPTKCKEDRSIWLTGPEFVTKDPSEWPENPVEESSFLVEEGLTTEMSEESEQKDMDTTFKNIQEKIPGNSEGIIYTTVTEIKKIQEEHFPEELAGKATSLKRNLGLFIDEDGILRCKGRLVNANWTYDKRYPILIPKDSDFTNEIIRRTHEDNYHVGASHTLSTIRQSFWIPQGKRQVLKIISKCPQCIKHGGGPFKLPPTPALPPERVNYTEPFTFTGIDYLGPVLVKTNSSTTTEKRWICLLTCLAVRAVHLEVVKDLSTEEGLLALRRFISTRGIPAVITSDNATNFKLMSEVVTSPYCIERKIKWRFIPQLAPWFGGFYERLIGIVKNCMRRSLQKHLLTDNQLNTVVKEIEAVINSRPLTYVDSELTHILKPYDFLTMGRIIAVRLTSEDLLVEGTQTKVDLINSWKKGMIVLAEFKDMFVNRYLLSLRERNSYAPKQPRHTSTLEPSEGQVVQIKGNSKNREEWQVGKIVSLTKGTDGLSRVATVKVGNKEYTRSIGQLYPLEVEDIADNVRTSENERQGELIIDTDVNVDSDTAVCAGEKEIPDVGVVNSENTPNEHSQLTGGDINEIEMKENTETTDVPAQPRQRREAAVRALEKIAQWTQNLTVLFEPAGSVATSAVAIV